MRQLFFLLSVVLFVRVNSTEVERQPSGEASTNDEAVPTLSVCQALSHPLDYDGRIVHIKDRVSGTDEWTAFVSDECPKVLVIDDKTFPSAIVWEMPTSAEPMIHPVNFRFDDHSQEKLVEKWKKMKSEVDSSCVAFTYTGLFEVWSKAKAQKPVQDGWIEYYSGFGHLNGSGARLILKSADDVTALPNCKPRK
jgi:hypothetical protein